MYKNGVLVGPKSEDLGYPQSNDSYGKIIFDSLKTHDKNKIIMVDAFTKGTMTYGDVIQQSIQLAIGLRKLGVNKDDVVGIVSENSLRYQIPIIACFYIGAIVNPINNSYNTREIKMAFDISKPKVVFTSKLTVKSLIALKDEVDYITDIISFDSDVPGTHDFGAILKTGDGVNDFCPIKVDNESQVAAILCSSGTTGLPKGVMLTHMNFINTMAYISHPTMLGIAKGDSCIALLPFYHAFGMLLTISGLRVGMKLVILEKFKPDIFLKSIEEYGVTRLFLVPSLALFLAKSPMVDDFNLSTVTGILCAAAPLGSEVQNILEDRMKLKIQQAYGMTETCGLVTATNMCSINKIGGSGTLVNDIVCKVVDIDTHVNLGPNKSGEICCKSPKNMKGYMANETATLEIYDEESFIHTGDIGYYDQDGHFYIVDRLKELIKYKGFQVSPAELEDILISHDGVKEAAVIGLPDDRSGELPLAFVVRQIGSSVSEEELLKWVADHVSISKQLHGGVRFVTDIPKSSTGKILRRILKESVM